MLRTMASDAAHAVFGAAALLSCIGSSLAAKEYNPAFYADAWEGVCATGKMQTPIDLPARYEDLPPVPMDLVTDIKMPLVKKPMIVNKGSAIQITWDVATAFDMSDDTIFPMLAAGGTGVADVVLDPSVKPDRKVKMIPLQLHWHETSEHAWDGMLAAAETHIVTLVGPGEAPDWGCDDVWAGGNPVLENCTAVFGVMYRLGQPESQPAYLEAAIKEAPLVAGGKAYLSAGQLDLMSILPADLSYYSYVGSLTTPGCNEGLRWHVFNQQDAITSSLMQTLETIHANTVDDTPNAPRQYYRHNNRPIQPLNSRTVYFHDTGSAAYPGSASAGCYGSDEL